MSKRVSTVMSGHRDVVIPYSFTCNYCGCINKKQKKEAVFGSFSKSGRYGNELESMFENGLENEIKKNTEERIRRYALAVASYSARLRANEPLNPVDGGHPEGGLFLDGVCKSCGRCQVWDTEALLKDMPPMPSKDIPKWRSVLKVFSLIVMLLVPLGAIILATATSLLSAKPALIIAGVCFVVGLIGLVIFSPEDKNIALKRYTKKYLTERIASEPNAPDNLPDFGVRFDKE